MRKISLPEELVKNGRFCCWRYEERNGRKTKVPYQPDTGFGAKSNDPNSFVTYETAIQAVGYDGIGIGIFDGICAIDLDDCVSEEGCVTKEAAEIVELMHSYTEYSPSGHGLAELEAIGSKGITGRYTVSKEELDKLKYLAEEGIHSRGEISSWSGRWSASRGRTIPCTPMSQPCRISWKKPGRIMTGLWKQQGRI